MQSLPVQSVIVFCYLIEFDVVAGSILGCLGVLGVELTGGRQDH